MPKDLRDPEVLGRLLLIVREAHPDKPLSKLMDFAPDNLPNYDANPTCIEKYGRPQDLPPTPF